MPGLKRGTLVKIFCRPHPSAERRAIESCAPFAAGSSQRLCALLSRMLATSAVFAVPSYTSPRILKFSRLFGRLLRGLNHHTLFLHKTAHSRATAPSSSSPQTRTQVHSSRSRCAPPPRSAVLRLSCVFTRAFAAHSTWSHAVNGDLSDRSCQQGPVLLIPWHRQRCPHWGSCGGGHGP